MECADCSFGNPAGMKFCGQCGAPLGVGSGSRLQGSGPPAPRNRNPEPQRAKHLADKVLASRAVMEGERKQVTVLFADVRGSMELAEAP